MATMLNVYDRQTRKKTAVLQNAYDITETHELNQIYSLSFKLPSTDEKNKYCLPRHFVRWGDDGELYRIKSPNIDESNVRTITYECEHVITTLCDTVMFGSFQYGGASVHTRETIDWLLSQQKQQDWVLDVCEFDRKFEYLWEQENILNALYSIPKEFAQPYKWTFDTTVYPWKLSLRVIDETIKPEYYLRAKSNILASGSSADYANITTRIYPLGYGEGVNQLNIKDVNNGVAYIQSPQSIIDQYGIVEKVLVDRRFENAESLMAYAQTMLDKYQTPSMSRSFSVTDLYPLTGQSWDDAEVGKICRMTQDGTTAYITRTQMVHDKAGDLQIDLSTKATDITSSVADLADRIRIESVYAQGATQLYQHSKDANATPEKGMVMSLYFPAEMRQINKVLLRLKLNKFRSYSQTSDYGGAIDNETGAAGSIEQNTESGGAIDQSTDSGGAIDQNTGLGGSISQNTGLGGSINQNTGNGGAIDTSTGSGGGGTGQTGVASGGGNLSLSASASIDIYDTGDANWTNESSIPTSKTNVNDYENYGTQMTTVITGSHVHDLTGHVQTVTPLQSQDYKHTHYLNSGDATAGMNYEGSHSHTVNDATGHSHGISKSNLKHYHSGAGSVTVTINNSNGGTQSNFSHSHSFKVGDHTHNLSVSGHSHSLSVGGHTHKISIGWHTHPIRVSGHRHNIKVSAHKHAIIVPAHRHGITAGIFESGNATAFDIYVNSTKKATVNSTSYDGDITTWLLNNQNLVPRDTWIDVTIVPNDLAYVVSSVFVQGFVQSRGGGNY